MRRKKRENVIPNDLSEPTWIFSSTRSSWPSCVVRLAPKDDIGLHFGIAEHLCQGEGRRIREGFVVPLFLSRRHVKGNVVDNRFFHTL